MLHNQHLFIAFLCYIWQEARICAEITRGGDGVCLENQSSGSFCCQGYRENKNVCEDCPAGTFGINCNRSCLENFYGVRCILKCDCSSDEVCDRKVGCVRTEENSSVTPIPVIVVVVIVVIVLLIGIMFVCWKRQKTIFKWSSDWKVSSIFQRRRTFIQSHEKGQQYDDDGNLYAEIRESMMIKTMTTCERSSSFLRTSYIYPQDRHDYKSSIKSHDNASSIKSHDTKSDGYVKIELNDNVYIDPVEQPIKGAESKMCMIYELDSEFVDKCDIDTEDTSLAGETTESECVILDNISDSSEC